MSLNIVWLLLLRSFLPRSRKDGFRLVWAILEPAGSLAVLILIFSLIGRTPGYGRSFALFLLTGIIVLTAFNRFNMLVKSAMKRLSAPSRLPAIGMFHEAMAQTINNLVVTLVYSALLFYAVHLVDGVTTSPAHPLRVALAYLTVTLFGFGFGLLRAYCAEFLPPLERVYGTLSRGLLFVSGVFYVPSFMPPQFRELLIWNPVLQCVELMRLGMYDQYPSTVFRPGYLALWTLGSVTLGVTAFWRKRAVVMG